MKAIVKEIPSAKQVFPVFNGTTVRKCPDALAGAREEGTTATTREHSVAFAFNNSNKSVFISICFINSLCEYHAFVPLL